ncbi:MAG: tetratricopeptide repeat protein, partial [Deferribacterota bacterium]|nr:tetratricopeptide repeat protein [Deferribacterota bacterium]
YLIKYFINLRSELDTNFLKTLINNFEFNELKDLFNALHKKYKNVEIYKVELDCFIDKKDFSGINYALHKIAELTDEPILMEAFEYIALKSEKVDQPNILFNIGLLAVRLKKYNQARGLFNKALQFIDDSDIDLRKEIERNLSDVEKNLKDYDLQYEKMNSGGDIEITDVKKIEDVGLNKTNNANIFDNDNIEVEVAYDEEGILSKAKKLIEKNLYKEVIKELEKLNQSNRQLDALLMIAECYEKLDNKKEAINYYKRSLEKLDNNNEREKYLIRIANLYFDIGDRKNTFNTIIELARLDPSYKF